MFENVSGVAEDSLFNNVSGVVGIDNDNNTNGSADDELSKILNEIDKSFDKEKAKELDARRKYRKLSEEDLQHSWDGSLETDTDLELALKTGLNKTVDAVDWLLEASEHIADFGQGDWLDRAHIDAVIDGRDVDMANKSFFEARDYTPNDIKDYIYI
jgi:hypothetical protein